MPPILSGHATGISRPTIALARARSTRDALRDSGNETPIPRNIATRFVAHASLFALLPRNFCLMCSPSCSESLQRGEPCSTWQIHISTNLSGLAREAAPAGRACVAYRLIDSPTVVPVWECTQKLHKDDERRGPSEEPDEAPETPTDEPRPAPVQDPPAEPDRPPYVVKGLPVSR